MLSALKKFVDPEPATLNLNDIQGNIVKGYGRFGFPFARYVFYSVQNARAGRKFVSDITPMILNGAAWKTKGSASPGIEKPEAAVNIAFSYNGLKMLGLPTESLHGFPDDFAMGMRARRDINGDDGVSAPEYWDPIWNCKDACPDIFVSINGQTKQAIEIAYEKIQTLLASLGGGVILLTGHKGPNGADNLPYQEASAIFENGEPIAKEHFGYTDGISNPFFKGTGENPAYAIGAGKPTRKSADSVLGWEPLEPGEFILGQKDEAQELPKAPKPHLLGVNGTFMVYRKIHQNTGSFDRFLKEEAARYPDLSSEYVAAKFAGRWRNGAPLSLFPTQQEAEDFMQDVNAAKGARRKTKGTLEHAAAELRYIMILYKLVGFDYTEDLDGGRCPVGAHIRRCNPRSALEFGAKNAFDTPGALSNRRRIIRRGLPYGETTDRSDKGDHGIIFMGLCASISRQFEFVQQQWLNYGNDFKLGNEKDPICGNHGNDAQGRGNGRMIFPAQPGSGKSPHFCQYIPRLVETRGGEYYFVPSMTALAMIGDGTVDPT